MKRRTKTLICAWFLCLCSVLLPPLSVSADGGTMASEPTETVQVQEAEGTSKGSKIAGFLAIFTAAMGTTIFIIMRPKIKMLKEIKKK